MQTFELYGVAWLVYLILGSLLLALVSYQIKGLTWHMKFGIISFLAVGAFTPDTVVNAETFAPLVITALLNAEIEGSSAIVSGLLRLVIIWGIVFFAALAVRHFWRARNQQEAEKQ